ncbi:MAG: Rnf-Nqr domain containing protein [Spirochaetia bacterium]
MTRPSGFLRKNPVAVALVGLCPAAAVTGRVIDALWMSLGLVFVLVLTRVSQAILHGLNSTGEPPSNKAPATKGWLGCLFLASCFTASFELILQAFAPDESASLGIYVSLLAVNCIVLDRLGEHGGHGASGRTGGEILRALQGSATVGAGFAVSLVAISLVREILGSGTITLFPVGSFGGTVVIGNISLAPARALIYAGGAFLCLGYLAGAARLLGRRGSRPENEQTGTEAGPA